MRQQLLYCLICCFGLPTLCFGQLKKIELVKRDGLTYEKESTTPFIGIVPEYFDNRDTEMIVTYQNGKMNGPIAQWYKKGKKQFEGYVENDKKTGVWRLYYENGSLKKQTSYRKDLENGEEIFWNENGKIAKKGNYINGKLNGKYTWYYESGAIMEEGFFTNGLEDSSWNEWFENGKHKMKGQFTDGKKTGNWIWWDENGSVVNTKKYENGLVASANDSLDMYLERMEFFLKSRNYRESLKYSVLAENTVTDKTENNPIYMGLVVYHSVCYSRFSHFKQGEKVLLDALGLTKAQVTAIQNSVPGQSPDKIKKIIDDLNEKEKSKSTVGNHIVISLCYNMLGDSDQVRTEQQLMMDKGHSQDWILNITMELYRLVGEQYSNYTSLMEINAEIAKQGTTEKLELDKAQYLIRTESFDAAEKIADKYLLKNDKNITAILLKADIAMARRNIDQMTNYENKARNIDPNSFRDLGK